MTKRGFLKPHPLVVPLMRTIVLRFLKRRYRLEAADEDHVRNLKPPFLVVANHVNFWDPFWINAFIAAPIQFVASDNLFRTTLFGLAMRLLGSIPKTKLMNDAQTVGPFFAYWAPEVWWASFLKVLAATTDAASRRNSPLRDSSAS